MICTRYEICFSCGAAALLVPRPPHDSGVVITHTDTAH